MGQRWLLAGLMVATWPGLGSATVDPHDPALEDRCSHCHLACIAEPARPTGQLCLVADTPDGTCLACHSSGDCCQTGQSHQGRVTDLGNSHPSDIPLAEVSPDQRPRRLPSFAGRITCNTCHLHDRRPTGDYKLLRVVAVRPTGVDWTALCTDCHASY